MLNQKWINKYKLLVKELLNKEIDDEKATEELTRLINLARILYKK